MRTTMGCSVLKWAGRAAAVAAALAAAAPRVWAQGCAMCYTEAAAQGPRARLWLDFAILTLLIPSVLLFAGIMFAALRRRDRELAGAECLESQDATAPQMRRPDSKAGFTPNAVFPSL